MKKYRVKISHNTNIKTTIEFDNAMFKFVDLIEDSIVTVDATTDNEASILIGELYVNYLAQYFNDNVLELKSDISTLYFKIYKFETSFGNFENVYNFAEDGVLIFEGNL